MSYSQSGNIVPSPSGSMFTPSELALIQAGKWLPELSHFVPVTSPHNLDDNLNHARDEGEKIDLLIHTALNPHAPALIGLGEFLQRKDLTILAATLRGFAIIGETLDDKKLNLDPNYRHHLEHLRYVLTANLDLHDDENPSVHLFKRLCHDAESGGSEMVRWAAAHALQELDYPLNLRRQLLSRPPAEILAEIWTKYESRLSDQKRENDPSKVSEDIKFGIYGHTEKLFAESRGTYSLSVVRQILRKSGMRGIRLALKYGNRPVLTEAVNFAGDLFNQINPNSQDKRYKDNATRQRLADLCLPFLTITDLDLRNQFAEKLNDKHNQYNVSDCLITDENNRAKVAVIDADWQRIVSLGDICLPFLCQLIEGSLRLEIAENLNTNCQITAAESIDNILQDISKKLLTLSPYLQHDNQRVRESVANLLQPHKSLLDAKAKQIISALLFQLNLPDESEISPRNSQLDKLTVENHVKLAETNKQAVQKIFINAISACESKSILTKDFLTQQQKDFLERIARYLADLNSWLQNHANDLQAAAKAKEEELKNQKQEAERQVLCRKLMEDKTSTENELTEIEQKIKDDNNRIEKYSDQIRGLSYSISSNQTEDMSALVWDVFFYPLTFFFSLTSIYGDHEYDKHIGLYWFVAVLLFIAIVFLLVSNIISWDFLRIIAILIYVSAWGYRVYTDIRRIVTSSSAKSKTETLKLSRSIIEDKVITLKKQKGQLQQQLYAIENRRKENKC